MLACPCSFTIRLPDVFGFQHRAGVFSLEPRGGGGVFLERGVPEGGGEGEDGLMITGILDLLASHRALTEVHVGGSVEDDLPGRGFLQVGKHFESIFGFLISNRAIILGAGHQQTGDLDVAEGLGGVAEGRWAGTHHHGGIDSWFGEGKFVARKFLPRDGLGGVGTEGVAGHADGIEVHTAVEGMFLVLVPGGKGCDHERYVLTAGDDIFERCRFFHRRHALQGGRFFPDGFVAAGMLHEDHHIAALGPMIAEIGIVITGAAESVRKQNHRGGFAGSGQIHAQGQRAFACGVHSLKSHRDDFAVGGLEWIVEGLFCS